MSKLGCSLKEAFGESWDAGPKYYQTSPHRFRTAPDPYSTNTTKSFFTQGSVNNEEEYLEEDAHSNLVKQKVDAYLSSKNLGGKAKDINKTSQKEKFMDYFLEIFTDSLASDRIDCLIKFALISILVINIFDLVNE